MRLLYLTNKPVFPVVDGGCRAMERMLDCFQEQNYTVKHLCVSTDKHPFQKEAYPLSVLEPETVYLNTKLSASSAFLDLLLGKSYHISRFNSDVLTKRIVELIESFQPDVIFIESLYLTTTIDAIRKVTKMPIVVRTHNVEHLIWERLAQNTKNPLKAWYLKKLTAQLKKYEIAALSKADALAVISATDAQHFKHLAIHTPMQVIPIALPERVKQNSYSTSTFFHLGSMNWGPNIEAVQELLVEIFPKIREVIPDAKLILAGSFMPNKLANSDQKGVEVRGFVDNPNELFENEGIFISPIRSGSGVRVKLLEALHAGAPVLTTKQGAEGIEQIEGIVLAETVDEFVKKAITLHDDLTLRKSIGMKGAEFIQTHYSIPSISKKLHAFISSI